MKKRYLAWSLVPIYALVLVGFVLVVALGNQVVRTMSEEIWNEERSTVIIDPGHGGVDGGATSYSGVLESKINLDIALKLNDMMRLLGIRTIMIRETDRSIYTEGETIAQKKASDLRERVRIINETRNALVVSIHQNTFPDEKYWGAQVFYPKTSGSKELADMMQKQLNINLMPDNNRLPKVAKGIYLMEHIQNPGILLECGFLSNPQEEALLRSEEYQKQLCAVITGVCAQYLDQK